MLKEDAISKILGFAAEKAGSLEDFRHSLGQRSAVALRLRPDIADGSTPENAEPIPWFARGRFVPFEARPSRALAFITAEYYLQDAGSMLALAACKVRPNMRVCDLCAAPGGKATGLVELMSGSGWLLANEPIVGRVAPLAFSLGRTRTSCWAISQADPERLADRLSGEFDLVLVDAPCSGQALIARDKQSEAAWSMRQIEHSAARQRRILNAAIRLLRPGGQLVYSTCTFAELENEGHLDWLADEHGAIPDEIPALQPYASYRAGAYRLWPHRDGCAGAFVASLRFGRANDSPTAVTRTLNARRHVSNALIPDLGAWGEMGPATWLAKGPHQYAWPDDLPSHWLDVVSSGPEVAFLTGKTWQPGYSLALRQDSVWQPHRTLSVDTQTARSFLTGQALPNPMLGWQVVQWGDVPIAWGKGDGRRLRPVLSPALRALSANLSY